MAVETCTCLLQTHIVSKDGVGDCEWVEWKNDVFLSDLYSMVARGLTVDVVVAVVAAVVVVGGGG